MINDNSQEHHEEGCCQPEQEQQECCVQLESYEQQLHEWKTKCMQVSADFENFKRRADKERMQWATHAQDTVLTQILTVADDLDRALTQARESQGTDLAAFIKGIEMVASAVHKILDKHGVKEIDQMHTFDPTLHEALMNVDSTDHKSGAIVQVLQKGFMRYDAVLRPAKVSVAR